VSDTSMTKSFGNPCNCNNSLWDALRFIGTHHM
jgi:hypothetical protein